MSFGSTSNYESEREAKIIISFTAYIKLCHQAYMI